MELPIINFPTYVEELSIPFYSLFKQERQLMQFKRLITGFGIADKHTIAHMNGLFTNQSNQSNLNRFVTYSDWDQNEMNRIKMSMINDVEKDGIVILDDYIVEKTGKEIYGTDWHMDGKGNYGLKECQLRSDEAVKKYNTPSTLAATLLEIASLLSPVYATLTKRGRTHGIN